MNITRGRKPGAKKIVVYGPEGIGKSTFAAGFPDPVFIDTEDSTKDMDVARFDKPSSWAMLIAQVEHVIHHPDICKTLVLDTADWAEQIEVKSLCEKKGWNGLEDPGYGKGYTYSAEEFGKLLNLLSEVTENGIHVVITAHAQLRKVELPEEMGAYDHWEMKTSKKVAPMIREWADAVFFANYKTRIVEIDKKKKAQGGQRIMYTNHTPFWDAKNRYGLPEELPFSYDSVREVIEGTAPVQRASSPEPARRTAAPAPVQTSEELPAKSKKEPPKEKEAPAAPSRKVEAVRKEEKSAPEAVVKEEDLDKRIPKPLRDLMLASNVGEWDLENIVTAKGYMPIGMKVADYPEDFVNEALIAAWDQVCDQIKKARKDMEIPFSI